MLLYSGMNLLEEYDFDALPYIDKEYEHPDVQRAVNQLIADEMRSFVPRSDYIAHMPYPKLKFASAVLQTEMARVANSTPMEKLDLGKYAVEAPEGPMAKDIQAWRKAVSLAKIQYEYQSNRLMNLELADTYGGAVWLHSNAANEGITKQIEHVANGLKRSCEEINLSRKRDQETAWPSLVRMENRTKEVLAKTWQIKKACDDLEHTLKKQRS